MRRPDTGTLIALGIAAVMVLAVFLSVALDYW
jgi:hypothetical protein